MSYTSEDTMKTERRIIVTVSDTGDDGSCDTVTRVLSAEDEGDGFAMDATETAEYMLTKHEEQDEAPDDSSQFNEMTSPYLEGDINFPRLEALEEEKVHYGFQLIRDGEVVFSLSSTTGELLAEEAEVTSPRLDELEATVEGLQKDLREVAGDQASLRRKGGVVLNSRNSHVLDPRHPILYFKDGNLWLARPDRRDPIEVTNAPPL